MESPQQVPDLLAQAQAAIATFDRQRARQLLTEILRHDPNNEDAWGLLSNILEKDAERRECLERVLKINPQNASARRALHELDKKTAGDWRKPIAVIVVILLLCGSFPFWSRLQPNRFQAQYVPDRIGAYVACERFLKERLKAPATAVFQSTLDATIIPLSDNRWHVISYVDSENSFGANLRTSFTCMVQYVGNEQWSLQNLTTDP